MTTTTLPPVTEDHRQRAFAKLRMVGWTYEAAMADAVRARVIECLAHHLRTREWKAQHSRTTQLVRRLNPRTGRWSTQRVPGEYEPNQAAFGME